MLVQCLVNIDSNGPLIVIVRACWVRVVLVRGICGVPYYADRRSSSLGYVGLAQWCSLGWRQGLDARM